MFPPDSEAPGSPGVGKGEKGTGSSPGQVSLSITGLDKIQTALPPELLIDQGWDRAWNLRRGRHRGSQVTVSPPPTPQGAAQCPVHTAGPQQGFARSHFPSQKRFTPCVQILAASISYMCSLQEPATHVPGMPAPGLKGCTVQ